jgi:hypothetical protein
MDLAAGVYLSEAPWGGKAICRFGIWLNTQCILLNLFTQGGGGGGGVGEPVRRLEGR